MYVICVVLHICYKGGEMVFLRPMLSELGLGEGLGVGSRRSILAWTSPEPSPRVPSPSLPFSLMTSRGRPYGARISERDLQPYPNRNAYALWPGSEGCPGVNPALQAVTTPPPTHPAVRKQKPCSCMACQLSSLCHLRAGPCEDAVPDAPDVFGVAARTQESHWRGRPNFPPVPSARTHMHAELPHMCPSRIRV